jgi:serine/threonine-protein phosphatase CPPED1
MKNKLFSLWLFIVFTIPAIGQEQPFYFIMLTDAQIGMYTSNKDFVRETANYEFAVAAVNRLKPGFLINLGDLINKSGDQSQIDEFLRISGKIDKSIPVYYVAGNHDVGNGPTPQTLENYRKSFGRDYYSFQAGPLYGIVLNSALIQSSKNAEAEYQEQNSWFETELKKAKDSGLRHIVVFMHHPIFFKDAQEPDQYGNMPLERRKPFLALLHQYGVRNVFAGHVHKNIVEKDGDLQMTAIGPVAMPFDKDGSGICVVEAATEELTSRYYEFGRMPDALKLK